MKPTTKNYHATDGVHEVVRHGLHVLAPVHFPFQLFEPVADTPKQNLQTTATIAKLFELDERRVQQLAKSGVLPAASTRPYKFDLLPTIKCGPLAAFVAGGVALLALGPWCPCAGLWRACVGWPWWAISWPALCGG